MAEKKFKRFHSGESNAYVPVSGKETNTGYVDIFLSHSPLLPEVKYEWLFDLKYLKASAKDLDMQHSDAKKQLQDYSSSCLMKDRRNLKRAVILFIVKKQIRTV